jgi:Zn-finger nucleic acid-binding protein
MECPHCNKPTSPTKKCVHCGKEVYVMGVRDSSAPIDCPICNTFQYSAVNRDLCDEMKHALQKLSGQSKEAKRNYYLDCPVCGELMLRRNFLDVSGIILDTCANDGVWVQGDNVLRIMEIASSEKIQDLTRKSAMYKEYEKRQQDKRLREDETERAARQRELRRLEREEEVAGKQELQQLEAWLTIGGGGNVFVYLLTTLALKWISGKIDSSQVT